MALTKKAHTVRLVSFEEELLTQMSQKLGVSEEKLLLDFIRVGLKRQKLDGLESYNQREKKVKEALYQENMDALYSPSSSAKKRLENEQNKSEEQKLTDELSSDSEDNTNSDEQALLAETEQGKSKTDLDQLFLELRDTFGLSEPLANEVTPGQHYLLKGQKGLRMVTIDQVQENGKISYCIDNDLSQKSLTFSFKGFSEKARGPVSEEQLTQLQARLATQKPVD